LLEARLPVGEAEKGVPLSESWRMGGRSGITNTASSGLQTRGPGERSVGEAGFARLSRQRRLQRRQALPLRRWLIDRQTQRYKMALQPLKQALESHHRSLEDLERALIGFEEALVGQEERLERPQAQQQGGATARGGLDLLSITDVCQELGMGKSWIYRRIQSGEIPSVKLGRNIKVRREDLEGYLEAQRYR
jgi:excisionase family DNA binding protein